MTRTLSGLYGAYAALVSLVFIFGALGVAVVVTPGVKRRRRVAAFFIHSTLLLCGVRLRTVGRENLPEGPFIVTANHASYLDGLLLTAALPPDISYIVKDDASRWPWVGTVLRRLGVVFIAREESRGAARTTRSLLRRVKHGERLGVFPEGTFRAAPQLLPFKQGAFLLASRAQVPVVPVLILGSRRILGQGAVLPSWSPLRVEILPAEGPGADTQVLKENVRERMLEALTQRERAAQ